MSDSSLSTTLLQRVLARDPAAWERLVKLHGPLVYSRCRKMGLQAEDAANVVQEVFMAVYQSIGNFRRQEAGSSFRAWLLGITDHKLKDHWRRQAKNPIAAGGLEAQRRLNQLASPDGEPLPMSEEATEKNALLGRALEMLKAEFEERTWQAFLRFLRDGQSAAEVAAELGMSPGAVHIAVCRVRKRLREEFGDLLS